LELLVIAVIQDQVFQVFLVLEHPVIVDFPASMELAGILDLELADIVGQGFQVSLVTAAVAYPVIRVIRVDPVIRDIVVQGFRVGVALVE
jgi:hypothetical protein